MDNKYIGKIIYWNPDKQVGFLLGHVNDSEMQTRFFFHFSRILAVEGCLDDAGVGYFVRFDASKIPPRKGQSPFAINLEIFKTDPIKALSGKDGAK